MSSCAALRDVLISLNTGQGLFKQKLLVELCDIIRQKRVVEELNYNSLHGSSEKLTWNELFKKVHNMVVKVEQLRQKKETANAANFSHLCSSQLKTVVKQSSKTAPYLSSSVVMDCFLEVMGAEHLKRRVGHVYVEILENILTSFKKYRCTVSYDHWKDLIQVAQELFLRPLPRLERCSLLNILNCIVLHGTCQAPIGNHVRFLSSHIIRAVQSPEFFDVTSPEPEKLLTVSVTLCLQLARECRATVCHFGEEVIYHLVAAPYDKLSVTYRQSLHDLLLLQVVVHHPAGAREGSGVAYAFDWRQWRKCLGVLHHFVLTEMEGGSRGKRSVSSLLPPTLLRLGQEVCKQVFEGRVGEEEEKEREEEEEEEEAPSPKRRRVEGRVEDVRSILALATPLQSLLDPLSVCARLSLTRALLTKYPQVLKVDEFLPLLQILTDLQSTCKNETVIENICLCCVSLLQAEPDSKSIDKTAASSLWNKIWETTVRFACMNQNEKGTHCLLQALICHGKGNPEELLGIYECRTVKCSLLSVQTLSTIIAFHELPRTQGRSEGYRKKKLLEWLLPSDGSLCRTIPPPMLAKVLVQLSLLHSRPLVEGDGATEYASNARENRGALDVALGVIERDYAICCFEEPLVEEKTSTAAEIHEDKTTGIIDAVHWERVQDVLVERISYQKDQKPPQVENVEYLFFLVIDVWATMYIFQPWQPRFLEDVPFLLKHLSSHIERSLKAKVHTEQMTEHLLQLRQLLMKKHPETITEWLVTHMPSQLLETVLSVLVENHKSPRTIQEAVPDVLDVDEADGDESEDMSSRNGDKGPAYLDKCFALENVSLPLPEVEDLSLVDALSVECGRLLGAYCCAGSSISSLCVNFQKKLVDVCSRLNLDHSNSFHIVIGALQYVLECTSLKDRELETVLKILMGLSKKWFPDSEAASLIVWLMRGAVSHVNAAAGKSKEMLIALLRCVWRHIRTQKFGPNISISFIHVLEELVKVDSCCTWAQWDVEGPGFSPVAYSLFSFLESPFHLVRMAAARAIPSLLLGSGLMSVRDILRRVMSALDQSFLVQEDLSTVIATDEAANRAASALYAFVSIVTCSPSLHRRSLFLLLKFTKDKKLSSDLLHKALSLTAAKMDVPEPNLLLTENLSFLVRKWLDNEMQIEDLAELMRLDPRDFCERYKEQVVPELLLGAYEIALKVVCTFTAKSEADLFEECLASTLGALLPGLHCDDASARHAHAHLEGALGAGRVAQLITRLLPRIVASVLSRVRDPEHLRMLTGVAMPADEEDRGSDSVSTSDALAALTYLQRGSPAPGTPLLHFLSSQAPAHVHAALLALAAATERAPRPYRLLHLHHYLVLADALADAVAEGGIDDLAPHLVYSIVHFLLRVARPHEKHNSHGERPCGKRNLPDTTAIAAISFLRQFCQRCLPSQVAVLEKLFEPMTSTLVALAESSVSGIRTRAIEALDFLVVESASRFGDAVAAMAPLPADDIAFAAARATTERARLTRGGQSLRDALRALANKRLQEKGGATVSVESLRSLRHALASCTDELQDLFTSLSRVRGFSEDCARSELHGAIAALVSLAGGGMGHAALEAARCLGELGPRDLCTLALCSDARAGPAPAVGPADAVRLLACMLLEAEASAGGEAASAALHAAFDVHPSELAEAIDVAGLAGSKFLLPFTHGNQPSQQKSHTVSLCDKFVFALTVDRDMLWEVPEEGEGGVATWAAGLASAIFGTLGSANPFLARMGEACKALPALAPRLLPWAVALVANADTQDQGPRQCLEQRLRMFFACPAPVSALRCALDMVHFLRTHGDTQAGSEPSCPRHNLQLDWLAVAEAALHCGAHLSAVLYVELWAEAARREGLEDMLSCSSHPPLEALGERRPAEGARAQKILWEAYMKIQDADAIYGCGSSLLLDPSKRPLHFELQGQWERVLLAHDMQLCAGRTEVSKDLICALQRAGLHHVLDVYLRASAKTSSGTNSISSSGSHCTEDFQYECAWRLGKWDLQASSSAGASFEQLHFACMRAVCTAEVGEEPLVAATGAAAEARSTAALARAAVCRALDAVALESYRSVCGPLSQLWLLEEMEEVADVLDGRLPSVEALVARWAARDSIAEAGRFEDVEPALWQRVTLLRALRAPPLAAAAAIRLASLARQHSRMQVAAKCVGLWGGETLPPNIALQLRLEEAQMAWDSGDMALGKELMRALLAHLAAGQLGASELILQAQALKLYGNWMVETKAENSHVVMEEYFLKAQRILEKCCENINENMLDIYSSLAQFADYEYQNLVNYFKSPSYEIKKRGIELLTEEVKLLKKQTNQTKDDQRACVLKERQTKIDIEEIENTEKEKSRYLVDAVRYYLRCLGYGERNNLDVFRIASLWLDNTTHEDINNVLEEMLSLIPSHKFVPILPQMTPRTSNVNDAFTQKLNDLLERCAIDHPHHTLPLLLALANALKDQEVWDAAASSQNKKPEPRVLGARKLIKALGKKKAIGELVHKMDQMSQALVSAAYCEVPRGNACILPQSEPLRKLKKMENVLVPTLTIPVEPSCKYDNIVGIVKFEPAFSMVGGINAPRKITCIGTDGIKRPQLLKGRDDLRQDAVMQQVFTIMNMLLQKDKSTSKRKLLIRTYKVVPLSQRSGVIEWCENTVPLLVYLAGDRGDQLNSGGAHKRYYPEDPLTMKCRQVLSKASTFSNHQKLETFKKICQALHPVLRYFFFEYFKSPGVWFERRLAYIQSVATSSMIGYILGLGDRHLMNILMDKNTAEVIHIDFGIAFEMGKILPTPETVPFRLTRDIVDGMGVSGVEGVFRRSCEKTMTVLRKNKGVILTVLEVLLYDPLYAWTITPSKVHQMQGKHVRLSEEDSVAVNRMAERALQRLKLKLQGAEGDAGTSVTTQVAQLIQEAMDMGNLSRLYNGWEPYL